MKLQLSWMFCTVYEITTAGSEVTRLGGFCRKEAGRVHVDYLIEQKQT